MTAANALDLRTRTLTDRYVISRGRDYVLCWLMQALRAEENPVIDAAVALGNERGLPVVVLHTLDHTYPYASHRLHRFILEASQELEAGVRERGLRFARYVRRPGGPATVDVAAALAERAGAVLVDDVPTFVTHEYADRLAEALDRAVLTVDACCAVPMNAFPEHLQTTKAFRAAHTAMRDDHLTLDLGQSPEAEPYDGDLDLDHAEIADLDDGGLDDLVRECGVDPSVPPAPGWSGRRSAALAQLAEAVGGVVPRYKWTRNNPALAESTARISPWMHFGVLSPREVAGAVLDAEAAGDLHPAARWKFMDELLTWREWYHHRCRWEAGWHRWDGLPAWARETLVAHADDPRPHLYSLDELAHGETDDETWNAAQKQFAIDGWMNNNLRMYWGRQLVKWRPDPRDAFAATCYLNDRFSLDGRDASTYGGIRSGFGEVRPWRERPVYGTVAGKTDGALRKRDGVAEWLAEQAGREVPFRAEIPSDPPPEFDRYR